MNTTDIRTWIDAEVLAAHIAEANITMPTCDDFQDAILKLQDA